MSMRAATFAALLLLTACAGLDTRSPGDLIMDRSNPGVRQADQRCAVKQESPSGRVIDCRSGSLVKHHTVYHLAPDGEIRRWYRY